MILYSSATPKQVKRGILCYRRFAKCPYAAFGNSVSIDNYYMILYSSASPKQVKRGILCYCRFAKKGTMNKQSQEHQCWIWVEWSQVLHNTQSFLPPVGIRTTQSLFSKMAFTASLFAMKFEIFKHNYFLKKVSRVTSPVWRNGSYDGISSTTSPSSVRVTKLSNNLKPKLPIIYILRHKWCVIKEHGKTKLVYCVISQKQSICCTFDTASS